MNLESIIPFATFVVMALVVWGSLSTIADRQSRVADRLDRIIRQSAGRDGGTLIRKQERIQDKIAKTAQKFSKPLSPTNAVELGKLQMKLLNAGFRGEHAVQIYLGVKFITLLIALAVAAPIAYAKFGPTVKGMMYMIIGGSIGFYLPSFILGMLKSKRTEAIFLGLPDALDLLVVCVEAGLGLDAAMRRVAVELATATPVICEEFAIANFQLQMGRTRKDVLHDLGTRTGVDDMRSLAAVLIQAEKFGSSIAAALRVQSDSMRIRRRQLAEERAAKTAVQLLFPLVLFIFPGIFVVLVGPAGIQISETMMK